MSFNRHKARLDAVKRGIQAARRAMDLDEDTYRELLMRIGGKSSSKFLTLEGADKVLDEMNRLQGREQKVTPAGVTKGRPDIASLSADRQPLMRKVEALVLDMKLSWSYARAIAKRMHGVEHMEWCSPEQLVDIVTALTVEQKKRTLLASVDEQLARIGRGRDAGAVVAKALGHKRGDWTRNVDTLERVLRHLQALPAA
ncbi:MAG: hypothetical protein JWL63_3233 [Rhodocyclales bacterium]|nr:hypothetical protein [Rhodocyclales bacterium]